LPTNAGVGGGPSFPYNHGLMTSGTVLVTGGAGYIGSHTVRQLLGAGYRVVVLDDLSTGHRWAVAPEAELVVGNAGDQALVSALIEEHSVDAVVHFAGSIVVPESVADPLKYYGNNSAASRNLIEVCVAKGVERFVFSSSAAVYGIPEKLPVPETAPTRPINPYGRSKLITEWMLEDVAASPPARGFRHVILRYFNVAGASLDGTLGQATKDATHLIKVACEAACGTREKMTVYGTDYPTPDGTCVRDYIHVEDLARAHIDALRYLEKGGASDTFNCGYGRGFSVREVLRMIEKVSGVRLRIEDGTRRAGDASELVAESSKVWTTLGWRPEHDDLEGICFTAYRWEAHLRQVRVRGTQSSSSS
ncbi:MAG: UDP-glucose 4-epimerase GalE, partial [Steroidobacteraceae bacterium]